MEKGRIEFDDPTFREFIETGQRMQSNLDQIAREVTDAILSCDCNHLQVQHYRLYGSCLISECECIRFSEPGTAGASVKHFDKSLQALLKEAEAILNRIGDSWHGGAEDKLLCNDVDALRRKITRLLNPATGERIEL